MKFMAGFIVALVIMAGAALAIMYTGSHNVAASVSDNPIVEWYLSNTMIHSVTSRSNAVKAPPQFTDQQARTAAKREGPNLIQWAGASEGYQSGCQNGLNSSRVRGRHFDSLAVVSGAL